MKRLRAILITIMLAAALLCAPMFFVSCAEDTASGKTYTLTFETDGGTVIDPITEKAGAKIVPPADPQKLGYIFSGWYDAAENGSKVDIPEKMPAANITYYAVYSLDESAPKSKIVYNYNLGAIQHSGNVAPSEGFVGGKVTVKNGSAYAARGHRFVGWSTKLSGPVALTGIKLEGQYNVGEEVTLGETDITLYAQWAAEYTDANERTEDKIYIYQPLYDKGLGAAILVRADADDKLGFVASAKETGTGYDEFTFYMGDDEYSGRLLADNKYAVADETRGQYLVYDYVEQRYGTEILALDGFDVAVITRMVGNQIGTAGFGYYSKDAQYGDYMVLYCDQDTHIPLTDSAGNPYISYFVLEHKEIPDTEFDGSFTYQGYESGTFGMYENGELYGYTLLLNGYGGAKLYEYDAQTKEDTLVSEGVYKGTTKYEDYQGEWEYIPDVNAQTGSFKFILKVINAGGEGYSVYVEYAAEYDKTFTATAGGAKLALDGYGSARYTDSGLTLDGVCTVGSDTLITFLPYIDDGEGGYTVGSKMYFNVDWSKLEFTVNTTGIIRDGDTVTGYAGESQIVVIPDGVTNVTANAFNNSKTNVSLISVSIPSSVTQIGIRAFENDYTLRRAIFLSDTPINIDWTSENDPFRWGAGNFIIVVPEAAKAAYVAAWTDCKHVIKGSVEVTQLEEFEVENGVLVRYNGEAEDGELLEITIPENVTEIAANVFRGLDFIKSVDLNNVTKIGSSAFYGCVMLESITAANVTEVGDAAFLACYSLGPTVELPAIVTLGASSFSNCESLKLVRLGKDLTEVGDSCFTECHVYYSELPLFVEMNCATPPVMGTRVSAGNISFKIKIPNIAFALACYNDAANWNGYCRHLYIESGEEKGFYMFGLDTLELNGRAEFFASEVMLYEISGTTITFYLYDSDYRTYTTFIGTYANDTVTLTYDNRTYVFERYGDEETFTSADGKYTLKCDPKDLLPATYADTEYMGYAEVEFNGSKVSVFVNGYSPLIVRGFVENGKKYDITLSLDGRTLVYTKKAAEEYVRNILAADGSVINLHFTANNIYIFGTVKIDVGGGDIMSENYDWGVTATKVSDNIYRFTRTYKGKTYEITVTLSEDKRTFTYTYREVA